MIRVACERAFVAIIFYVTLNHCKNQLELTMSEALKSCIDTKARRMLFEKQLAPVREGGCKKWQTK